MLPFVKPFIISLVVHIVHGDTGFQFTLLRLSRGRHIYKKYMRNSNTRFFC